MGPSWSNGCGIFLGDWHFMPQGCCEFVYAWYGLHPYRWSSGWGPKVDLESYGNRLLRGFHFSAGSFRLVVRG